MTELQKSIRESLSDEELSTLELVFIRDYVRQKYRFDELKEFPVLSSMAEFELVKIAKLKEKLLGGSDD